MTTPADNPAELSSSNSAPQAITFDVIEPSANVYSISTGLTCDPPVRPSIQSIDDILTVDYYASEPINYLVKELIAEATVTMITGESGSGKTTFVSSLCHAINLGIPFAGLETQHRPILILDRENPVQVVKERFQRLGIKDNDMLKVWGGWTPDEPPLPSDPRILDWIRRCDRKPLIIIDSFVSYFPGDENNANEVRRFMDKEFRSLAYAGATPLVIAHTGKGKTSKDYRGSTDIKAGIDVGSRLSG